MSHERIESERIDFTPIYDREIVSNRKNISAPNGKRLWSFANLYFNARNPMLYRVVCEKGADKIALIGVDKKILDLDEVFVTEGNAARSYTSILRPSNKVLFKILKEVDREFWSEFDSSKRKIMAECLVPDVVPPQYIRSIYFSNYDVMFEMDMKIRYLGRNIVLSRQPDMFFQPSREIQITQFLSIKEGDMFFSRMHTLTISVNCVGVMGKGIT